MTTRSPLLQTAQALTAGCAKLRRLCIANAIMFEAAIAALGGLASLWDLDLEGVRVTAFALKALDRKSVV